MKTVSHISLLSQKLFIVLTLSVLTGINCKGQIPRSTSAPKTLEHIQQRIQKQIDDGKVPSISVAVYHNKSVLWLESFGYADIAQKIKATPNSIYPLASLSKSISATAVMTLVQTGRLDLNESVNKLIHPIKLKSNKWNTDQVRLWQILNMSAGNTHGWSTMKAEIALQDQMDQYTEIVFPPGSINHYSNFSWGLVTPIIEKATNGSLADLLKASVFDPLGMKNSLAAYDASRSDEMVTLYSSKLKPIEPYNFYPLAAAGYFSSVSDLLKYGMSFLDGSPIKPILNKSSITKMHHFDQGPEGIFKLGWGKMGDFLITNGSISGAGSSLVLVPSEDLVVVCLTNHTSRNEIVDQLAFEIAMTLAPEAKGMEQMGAYEKKFRTPYRANPKLTGEWNGIVRSSEAELPVKMVFHPEGQVSITIGKQKRKPLQSIIFNEVNILEASFKGIVPVPKYDPNKEVSTNLVLYLDNDRLVGYLAPSFSNNEGSFSNAATIELTKKP